MGRGRPGRPVLARVKQLEGLQHRLGVLCLVLCNQIEDEAVLGERNVRMHVDAIQDLKRSVLDLRQIALALDTSEQRHLRAA